jgi:hypothetical protein
MARIDVIQVGVLQGPDRHAALARPDGRAALLQAESPLLRVHKQGVPVVDVLLIRQRRVDADTGQIPTIQTPYSLSDAI